MKIAILGAGFTGLTAAFELAKKGHKVTIFEKEKNPGGLAIGFKERSWNWTLEEHYHHWFTNDASILNLAKEINHKVIIKRPKTSTYIKEGIYQLDSPTTLITFPLLNIFQRLRMGLTLALLRYNPFWKPFEKVVATKTLRKMMGKKAYEMIWEPLFLGKFGPFADYVSLAWFWARVRKRTSSLAYPEGGFLIFAKKLADACVKKGVVIKYGIAVNGLTSEKKVSLKVEGKTELQEFDKVIVTLPSIVFSKIAPQLKADYNKNLMKTKTLGATNLLLRLKKNFLKDETYWLNICDKKSPLMAVVEHTNFMDKKFYNDECLVYVGNYVSPKDKLYKMEKGEVLDYFDKHLKKINGEYRKNLIAFEFFKTPFAQTVMPVNYSKIIPSLKTPLNNVYLANISQVYPWDRGTNYAVELGQKVAALI